MCRSSRRSWCCSGSRSPRWPVRPRRSANTSPARCWAVSSRRMKYLLFQNATLRDAAERAYALIWAARLADRADALPDGDGSWRFASGTWRWATAQNTPRQPEEVYRERIRRLRRSLRRQVAFRLPAHFRPTSPREAEPTRPLPAVERMRRLEGSRRSCWRRAKGYAILGSVFKWHTTGCL